VIESRVNVRLHLVFAVVILILAGCDQESQNQKIASLEKANQELKATVEKSHAVEEYDLQAKCSKDAKAWFNENWQTDKDTLLLDFTNHYNKSMNKCFILVEYHYSVGKEGTWTNDMTIWDVYENVKYGNFGLNTYVHYKPTFESTEEVITCQVGSAKCKTIQEFNGLAGQYMNN
jgi:hypothetical protein